jgi:putative membrane protein
VLVALLIRWAVLALAFAITAWLLSGMDVSGGFGSYLWVSLLYGIVSAVIGTLLRLLTLPLMFLTFGLFAIVVNAILLEITDWLTGSLTIDEFFWTSIWAAIIIAVVAVLIEFVLALVFRSSAATGRAATA